MKPMFGGSVWMMVTADDRRSPRLLPKDERDEAGWLPVDGTAEAAHIQAGIDAREKLKRLRRTQKEQEVTNGLG